jgi:hypothetical protein
VTRIGAALEIVRSGRWEELRDVTEAQLALLRAQGMRWTTPLGKFVELNADEHGTPPRLSASQCETCDRLQTAIQRAARYGFFRPACLTRAVALSRMLDAHGIAGHRIRIGVSREHGSFTAHAWVELGHLILGESLANTLNYAPLTQLSVAGTPTLSRNHGASCVSTDA